MRASTSLTLVAGIAIGAIAMTSILSNGHGSASLAAAQSTLPPGRTISSLSAESRNEIRALDQSFASLAEYATPAVVNIRSESKRQRDVFGQLAPVSGEGSGVIIRPDGYIVTNDHVVAGFDKVTVVLNDGREFPGKVTRAEDSDIALVKIEEKDLPTLPFADSAKVKLGQFAMAIGSPFGFENSVTIGHVSALNRQNQIADQHFALNGDSMPYRVYTDLIQTDAPINMGNSGGPLINVDGQIIGINTSIYSRSGGSNGIGFAIPSNQVRFIAERLIEGKPMTRAAIGVQPENMKEFEKKKLGLDSGAIIREVTSDGPAAIAGLKKGDVIVRVGKDSVADQIDVRNAMLDYGPGSTVDVEYVRDGKHQTARVKLIDQKTLRKLAGIPDEPKRPVGPNFSIPNMPDFQNGVPRLMPNEGAKPRDGKPRLGVSIVSADDKNRSQFGIPAGRKGAVVVSVVPGSVAENAGIQPGDLITDFGGQKIESADQLTNAVKAIKSGERKSISYSRWGDGTTSQVTVDAEF